MRLMTLIRSCSLPFAMLLCCSLIGLWLPRQVNAQTNTPSINTPTPGAVTPTPYGWDETMVSLDFSQSTNFFNQDVGSWEFGQGFKAASGDLQIDGNGNEYGPITKIQLRYTAFGSGTVQVVFSYDGMSLDARLVNVSTCAGCSNIIIAVDDLIVDNFNINVEFAGQFTLHELNIFTFGGDEMPPTPVVVDGCPVLSPEQIAQLDPSYMQSCARCFVTPTPVRGNAISTQIMSVPTLDATFQIPVIVSGTPMTPTPIAVVPGGTATLTPTATNTPIYTSTPSYQIVEYDFTDAGNHGWIAMNYPATWGDNVVQFTGSGVRSFWNQGGFKRHYIQIDRLASQGTLTGVTYLTLEWNKPYSGGLTLQIFDTDGASITSTITSVALLSAQAAAGTYTFAFSPPKDLTGWGINIFTEAYVSDPGYFYLTKVRLQTTTLATPMPTSTPLPTNTPLPTGVPWYPTLDTSEAECSVPLYRDDTPAVVVPITIESAGYSCYTIVPDMAIEIPSRGTLGLDGLQVCVDWISFPQLQILGITLALDWVLVAIVATMIRYLLNF